MLSQILAVIAKEFKHIFEDSATLRLILFMQAFTFLAGGYLDLTTKDLPVAVVDEDRSVESRSFVQKIDATRTLKVAYVVDTPGTARSLMSAGRARMAVVIPADFHERRVRKLGSAILAIVDGSDSGAANQALSALEGLGEAVNVESPGQEAVSSVSLRAQTLFNPQGRLALFLLPGLIGFVLTEVGSMAMDSLINERDADTMTRLLMTPLEPTALLIGKVTPYLLLGLIDLVLILVGLRWVFDVPIRGSVFLLYGAGFLFILTLLSLGMLIAATSDSGSAAQKDLFLFILTVYLSGWNFPLTSLPKYFLPISYLLPSTHMIAIARSIAIRDAGFVDVLPHFAYLTAAPIVFMTIAVIRFKKSVEEAL